MKHCGRETCAGSACENWPKCKGETIPPWNCAPSQSTAQVSIREQDVLAAADALAVACEEAINHTPFGDTVIDCGAERIEQALYEYQQARNGTRPEEPK